MDRVAAPGPQCFLVQSLPSNVPRRTAQRGQRGQLASPRLRGSNGVVAVARPGTMGAAMTEGTHTIIDVARRLVRQVTVLSASPGAVLCDVGASADEALLIVSGIVELSETGEGLTRHVVAGSGTPRVFPQEVRARTEVKFARLPVAAFDAGNPDLPVDRLASVILELLHRRDLVAGASALFGSLDADAIADLERESDWIDLKRGDVLMRQGAEGDSAFVLLAGRLQERNRVCRVADGNAGAEVDRVELEFARLDPREAQDVVGERQQRISGGSPRSGTPANGQRRRTCRPNVAVPSSDHATSEAQVPGPRRPGVRRDNLKAWRYTKSRRQHRVAVGRGAAASESAYLA